ncbi:MAG: hypothetical protein R3C68_02405 [Myxococcota bacterium]
MHRFSAHLVAGESAWPLRAAARHHRRVHAAVHRVMDEAQDAGENIGGERVPAASTVWATLYELTMVLGALALCAYDVWVLLTRMRWM